MYARSRQDEATELTEATAQRITALETVLRNGLRRHAKVDFSVLRREHVDEPFVPGELGTPNPEPDWADFEPASGLFGGLFQSKDSRNAAVQEARLRFEQEQSAHRSREAHRIAALEDQRQQHLQRAARRRQDTDEHNAGVDRQRRSFQDGDPAMVEKFLKQAIESAPLPTAVPNQVEVGYRKDSRQLLILRDLPDTDIVPNELSFRYVRTRDAIEPTARKPADVRQRYADLIAQLALLTLRDAFAATSSQQVGEVVVNCHLHTTDRATGKRIRPCLLTVSAARETFDDLVLDRLEPRECLRHLNALVSPHPYDVEPVKPIFEPDLKRFRLVDAHDVAADLDSRTVLVEQSPTEFEHLVRQLFEAMGMQSWVTQASRDDGVDAIAVNPDIVMGGLAVIQAKRYRNIVPADAVRALWGVMDDKKAGIGILVTTSYFGKATHDFAHRNERVRLIEGPELKQLILDHLGKDVIVGGKDAPKRRS